MEHTRGKLEYNIVATNSIDIVSKEDESSIVASIISENDELGVLEKENAHHIVKCWNSHAKLVEACRETEEALIRFRAVNGKEYPDWQSLDWNFPARLTQIQAALAEGD